MTTQIPVASCIGKLEKVWNYRYDIDTTTRVNKIINTQFGFSYEFTIEKEVMDTVGLKYPPLSMLKKGCIVMMVVQ